LHLDSEATWRELLGYLNFSEGVASPRFERQISEQYSRYDPHEPWQALYGDLSRALEHLRGTGGAFANVEQAAAVLPLIFEQVLPAYRGHHADLLFHLSDRALFQPFFVARVAEAVLAQGRPWTETERIVTGALMQLNDFVGYRPVAVLETEQKIQPYDHERLRPIPLYIRDAGVASGTYSELIASTLERLMATDADILSRAHFDPRQLGELAVDPRAYDFQHPVNRRPNYQFGEWDPHKIDAKGKYCRFVLRDITLDALWQRVAQAEPARQPELLAESSVVLAGVMLMASGMSGSGPDTHDSTVTLDKLVPQIAAYRDDYYQQALSGLTGRHGERLRAEAKARHQPFGGARQWLNQWLARRRAAQLEHQQLALVFAAMGYPDASRTEAHAIPSVSARIIAELACEITYTNRLLDVSAVREAAARLPAIEDTLHRGIACGALVDPWNILGFQGQFSTFPALENSVPDVRVDQLLEVMDQLFAAEARVVKEAAAGGDPALVERVMARIENIAAWWDQFATFEVADFPRVHGQERLQAARQVATAVGEWHQAGESAGDIAFWRRHVAEFQSPQCYSTVVDVLIDKQDDTAAMALMMQWLSQADQVPLEDTEPYPFSVLAQRWVRAVAGRRDAAPRLIKFFDFLEVNADEYWNVPSLDFSARERAADEEEDDATFAAAYDGMTYRDSADDGIEGETVGEPAGRDFPLEHDLDRLWDRLTFLNTLARLWQTVAQCGWNGAQAGAAEALRRWLDRARHNESALLELMDAVCDCAIPTPLGTVDSLIEYDQRRQTRDSLLDGICQACVEMSQAARSLQVMLPPGNDELEGVEQSPLRLQRALCRGDARKARAELPAMVRLLSREQLLYVRIDKGGRPRDVARVRCLIRSLQDLLRGLPQLGLLRECYQLLKTVRVMEQSNLPGPGAVTEFDRLFQIATQSMLETVTRQSGTWCEPPPRGEQLLACAMQMVGALFRLWMEHSGTIRLSSLDALRNEAAAEPLRRFIRTYGRDLFTQTFLTLGNVRAILDQGAANYLRLAAEEQDPLKPLRLFEDLGTRLRPEDAARQLELVLQAIAENYEEYRDYNSTTTQSDYGDRLFVLVDLLRLKSLYERTAWNLRPVAQAHAILARHGHSAAARQWEQAFAQKTAEVADELLQQLAKLETAHGVHLPTISDRLHERFMKPFWLTRIVALVEPAMRMLPSDPPKPEFEQLVAELAEFMRTPTGSGLEIPRWLQTIKAEVRRLQDERISPEASEIELRVPQTALSFHDIQRQLQSWDEPLIGGTGTRK
jgi:hypothetical protein